MHRRRMWTSTGLAAAAFIGATLLAACGAGDASPDQATVDATATAAATTTAGRTAATSPSPTPAPAAPSPTPEASPAAGGYAPGTLVEIVADAVRLRAEPSTDAEQLGSLLRGQVATISDGPAEADGYAWYEVTSPEGDGWVAAGDEEHRWIAALPDAPTADLVFRFSYGCDVTPPLMPPTFTLTSDRTVVFGHGTEDGGWRAGRLTEAAFSDVRGATAGRPELQQSADYRPERDPDAPDPPGHGLCVYTFTIGPPADRIVVTSVSWFGDEEESTYYLPSPERRELDRLARQLMEGESFIGDNAWDVPPAPYTSQTYLASARQEPGPPLGDMPDLEQAGALSDVDAFGEPVAEGRCGYLSRAEVEELASTFGDDEHAVRLDAISYVAAATDDAWYTLIVSPRTPDGHPTCADVPRGAR